jgi:hypothetical protein
MKTLILAATGISIFAVCALAQERNAADDHQSVSIMIAASGRLKTDAVKLAMGPTSAPHKPSGAGDTGGLSEGQMSPNPATHKKSKHHRHSK